MAKFVKGVLLGLLGPIAFIAGVCYWIHRYTGRVPFPVSRPADGELIFQLVEPKEIPTHWARWQAGLQPLLDSLLVPECDTRER